MKIVFLRPEWLKNFEFPHYTFLSESEMLFRKNIFLGKKFISAEVWCREI